MCPEPCSTTSSFDNLTPVVNHPSIGTAFIMNHPYVTGTASTAGSVYNFPMANPNDPVCHPMHLQQQQQQHELQHTGMVSSQQHSSGKYNNATTGRKMFHGSTHQQSQQCYAPMNGYGKPQSQYANGSTHYSQHYGYGTNPSPNTQDAAGLEMVGERYYPTATMNSGGGAHYNGNKECGGPREETFFASSPFRDVDQSSIKNQTSRQNRRRHHRQDETYPSASGAIYQQQKQQQLENGSLDNATHTGVMPPQQQGWQAPVRTTNDQEEAGPKMSTEDLRAIYQKLEISVQGINPPTPIQKFSDAPFPQWMMNELQRRGYADPYPVQAVGWVVALQGRDMIGIAKTGSGKTLAYLLPALLHISNMSSPDRGSNSTSNAFRGPTLMKKGNGASGLEFAGSPSRSIPPFGLASDANSGDTRSNNTGPRVLVLAPTRELAMQIEREARQFASLGRVAVACVYGGVPKLRQMAALRRGIQMCIATPGRLLDFLEMKTTHLANVTYLVLDEADRMLDMGFEPQIRRIVSQTPPSRQTLMWSATWPKAVQQLAREFCRTAPIRVTVGSHDLQANESIRQEVEVCSTAERFKRLLHHLRAHVAASRWDSLVDPKVLVFCETKRDCDVLHGKLRMYANEIGGVNVIHGDKDQSERDRALAELKFGRCNVLIATDVASRGLDIKGVGLVVNYDIPKTIEGYVHRIGRTGRAGVSGIAITLFSDAVVDTERCRMAKEVCTVMQDVGQAPPPDLMVLAANAPLAPSSAMRYGLRRNFRGGFQGRAGGGSGRFGGNRGGRGRGGRAAQHERYQQQQQQPPHRVPPPPPQSYHQQQRRQPPYQRSSEYRG